MKIFLPTAENNTMQYINVIDWYETHVWSLVLLRMPITDSVSSHNDVNND